MIELLILQNRTPIEALKFFDDAINHFSGIIDIEISDVYTAALDWKKKNCLNKKWGDYPVNDICRALIEGGGKMFNLNDK